MHISGRFKETDFESAKADIGNTEADIESQKANIRNKLLAFSDMISEKTINHTFELFSKCGKEEYFGRTIVEDITGLKSTRASNDYEVHSFHPTVNFLKTIPNTQLSHEHHFSNRYNWPTKLLLE